MLLGEKIRQRLSRMTSWTFASGWTISWRKSLRCRRDREKLAYGGFAELLLMKFLIAHLMFCLSFTSFARRTNRLRLNSCRLGSAQEWMAGCARDISASWSLILGRSSGAVSPKFMQMLPSVVAQVYRKFMRRRAGSGSLTGVWSCRCLPMAATSTKFSAP